MNDLIDTDRNTANAAPTSWLVGLGLALYALLGLRTIGHADFWTHLATGRWMSQHGIPRADPLTLFSDGAAWVNTSWLYDRILFAVWELGGAPFVVLLHIAVVCSAFALLVRITRAWASPLATAFALLVSVWLLAPLLDARPTHFALLFAALFLVMLSTPRSPGLLFASLIPLQILWANMDASFIWGPVMALVFTAQSHFTRSPKTAILAGLTAALALAPLINPYGTAIYSAMWASWTGPVLRDWISLIHPQMQTSFTRHMITLALIIGAGGLLTRKERLPIGLTSMAVLSAFLVVRSTPTHVDFFAAFAFPFLALSFQAIGDFFSHRVFPRFWKASEVPAKALSIVWLLLFLLSVGLIWTNRYYAHTGSLSSVGWTAVTTAYPMGAERVITHPDFPERALNLPVDGGYLAWAYPDRKPFIDQRASLHGPAIFHDLGNGLAGRTSEWHRIESDWAPEAVIINNAWPFSAEAVNHIQSRPGWATIYFDGTTTILLRDRPEHAALLQENDRLLADGLQELEHFRKAYAKSVGGIRRPPFPTPLLGGAAIFQGRGFYDEAAACYTLITKGAPGLLTAQLNLGICQTRGEDFEAAAETLESALERLPSESPSRLTAHLHLGIAQIQMGRHSQALRNLNQVTRMAPGNPLGWLWLSRAYEGLGQSADARQAIERARAVDATFTEAFLSAP